MHSDDGRGYDLPELLTPDRICFRISVPNDRENVAAFLGQISELGYWYNWEREGSHFARLVSAIWFDIYVQAASLYEAHMLTPGDCSMVDCNDVNNCIPNVRLGSIGGIQWRNGSTGLWEDIPQSGVDPRTDGTVTPPWSNPPVGQTGNCLAAANITAAFQQQMNEYIRQLQVTTDIFAIAGITLTIVGFIFPPAAIVTGVAFTLAGAGIGIGYSALSAALTTAQYTAIRCLLDCHIQTDGTISAVNLANIRDDASALLSSTVNSMFQKWLDVFGVNGLMKQEKLANIVSADCSTCGCGWCYLADFSGGNQGFTAYSNSAVCFYAQYLAPYWDNLGNHVGCSPQNAGYTFIERSFSAAQVFQVIVWSADQPENANSRVVLINGTTALQTITQTAFTVEGPLYKRVFNFTAATATKIRVEYGQGTNGPRIARVQIRGNGTNPIGANNC